MTGTSRMQSCYKNTPNTCPPRWIHMSSWYAILHLSLILNCLLIFFSDTVWFFECLASIGADASSFQCDRKMSKSVRWIYHRGYLNGPIRADLRLAVIQSGVFKYGILGSYLISRIIASGLFGMMFNLIPRTSFIFKTGADLRTTEITLFYSNTANVVPRRKVLLENLVVSS